MTKLAAGFSVLTVLLCATPSHAQSTQTWVSGTGDDINPCSRTLPCKTFAAAIARPQAGGQISILDPGGFGGATVTKSISIASDNSGEAGILAAQVSGVIVNGANAVVHLRGVVIDGGPPGAPGTNGVRFMNGAALHIQNCVIRSFASATPGFGNGVLFAPPGSAKLAIRDTHITRNGAGTAGGGVVVKPTGGFSSVTLTRVTMDNNSNGLAIGTTATANGAFATLTDSAASANLNTGIALIGNGGSQSFLALDRVHAANNAFGVTATGADSNVLLSNSAVTGNTTGLSTSGNGKIVSYLNNVLLGNTNAGAPTPTQDGQ